MNSKLLKRCWRNLWKIQKARGEFASTVWMRHASLCLYFARMYPTQGYQSEAKRGFQNARTGAPVGGDAAEAAVKSLRSVVYGHWQTHHELNLRTWGRR